MSNEASNDQLARECIARQFHDCEFQYLVHSSKIKLEKGTNNILINNRQSGITATKTVKTVLHDKKRCVQCKGKSNYAAVVRNTDTQKKNIIFMVKGGDDTFQALTKDHILSKSRGGTDNFKNLQSMCSPCNSEKGDTPDFSNHKLNSNEIAVDKAHYELLIEKQKDFAFARKRIKKVLKQLPWYVKMFGLHKKIERELKEPLVTRGYYQDGTPVDKLINK